MAAAIVKFEVDTAEQAIASMILVKKHMTTNIFPGGHHCNTLKNFTENICKMIKQSKAILVNEKRGREESTKWRTEDRTEDRTEEWRRRER